MEEKNKTEKKTKSGASVIDRSSGYIAAFLLGAGIAGGACWYFMDYSQRDIIETGKEFAVTKECRDIIEANGGVSDNDPVKSAIEAYVKSSAKDDFTYYYEDNDTASMTAYVNTSGTAECSGFQIAKADDGNILLAEVTDGMPAYEQGLRKGDLVTEINGVSVIEEGYENIANRMLGKDGTEVDFTVLRKGKTSKIHFVRASKLASDIVYKSLGSVDYIQILGFGQIQKGQMNSTLENAKSKKLIIDLRDNTGGDIEAGVYMAALISGRAKCVLNEYEGKEVVYEQDFGPAENKRDIIVLINGGTASTAEIMAACLKSNADAKLVGTKTYGKGIYQNERKLSNGAYLHFTAGTYYVEGWDNWNGKGIAPDVEISMDNSLIGTDDDIQLKKALELLD